MPQAVPQIDDAELMARCEEYLAALHAGDRSLCLRLCDAYPGLRSIAPCLDALDGFTAAGYAPNGVAASADWPTVHHAGPDGPGGHDRPSREFGRYELLEEIGRGGMGVVYRARQCDLNRVVALKMILSNRLAAPDDVKRFYREARAAGRLRHQHIVGIHEVGQVHGQHFFAMDFVSGTSLSQVLGAGPVDSERAARCLVAVARAVQYLHDHGIIHRDLKPSNILIDDAGTPYVSDFGLAKVFQDDDECTQSGVILGTPGYMPPEQAAGRISQISPRSDVYSLGAILYEMLTGRAPFKENNPLNTLLQVLEGDPTLPHKVRPQVPPELERICLRCLEKDPARRFESAAALADELDRYLKSEPLETRPATFRDRVRRWIRRDTGLAARLAILTLAVGIIQAQHMLSGKPFWHHPEVKLTFAIWTLLGFAFQWLLRRERTAELARVLWAVSDPILMMVVLNLAPGEVGMLLVGYPLLVVASGLWFSVRLVAISTVACLLSFAALLLLKQDALPQPHYPLIFAAALVVIGFTVAFQVHRVRTLSRYFDQGPWPGRRDGS